MSLFLAVVLASFLMAPMALIALSMLDESRLLNFAIGGIRVQGQKMRGNAGPGVLHYIGFNGERVWKIGIGTWGYSMIVFPPG